MTVYVIVKLHRGKQTNVKVVDDWVIARHLVREMNKNDPQSSYGFEEWTVE